MLPGVDEKRWEERHRPQNLDCVRIRFILRKLLLQQELWVPRVHCKDGLVECCGLLQHQRGTQAKPRAELHDHAWLARGQYALQQPLITVVHPPMHIRFDVWFLIWPQAKLGSREPPAPPAGSGAG